MTNCSSTLCWFEISSIFSTRKILRELISCEKMFAQKKCHCDQSCIDLHFKRLILRSHFPIKYWLWVYANYKEIGLKCWKNTYVFSCFSIPYARYYNSRYVSIIFNPFFTGAYIGEWPILQSGLNCRAAYVSWFFSIHLTFVFFCTSCKGKKKEGKK